MGAETASTPRIVCVERRVGLTPRLRALLGPEVEVVRERSTDCVLELFERGNVDVLLVTGPASRAGDVDGIEVLEVVSAKSPGTQVLLLIEPHEIALARSALRAGSYQYAKLPIADDELRMLVQTALERRPAYAPNLLFKGPQPLQTGKLFGRSAAMVAFFRQLQQAASSDIPVLLTGETGTGKDLAARAIHDQSPRAEQPYLPVHLGALPPELVASDLFGHEKGAFTGATDRRIGTFERADGGTVFIDEIATIDEKTQISLLRLLEQKQFERIGGRRPIHADTRLIAASNEDLEEAVARGAFREDLLFRLDVFHIIVPPLRDRHGDVPLLISEFLGRFSDKFNKNIVGIAPECLALLDGYPWPGNVRELKNVIQRAVLVCEGETLLPEHLPPRFQRAAPTLARVSFAVGTPLREVERELIVRTLECTGSNRKRTAELLGISRRALYNKLDRYHIT